MDIQLRHLLARRLTRLGRWKEARAYFPTAIQPKLDSYVAAIQRAHDRNLGREDRADAFWKAATIARSDGMELLGTELEPDSFAEGGSYHLESPAEVRSDPRVENVAGATDDEIKRAARSAPEPDRRFHYRYVAANHAWSAAELMPDESDATARVLYEAGSWIAPRNPGEAEPFYQALVSRCRTTELGKAAIKAKWFPKQQPR